MKSLCNTSCVGYAKDKQANSYGAHQTLVSYAWLLARSNLAYMAEQ